MEEFTLVRDFAIIMAVAGGALVLSRKLGQPPILGYLMAGLIVGPFLLPNLAVQNTRTVRTLADLGLVLLLFSLGLEFGWERIRAVGSRVVFIAAIEITFMLALGYEIGILLGWSGTESVFLGAALSISSSAVLFKMLRDTGKLHESRGRLIVGILVVEDFAAMVILSILSGMATTGTANLSDIGSLAGRLALFTAAALVLGALFAPRLLNLVARFHSQETLLITSLALCFGLALVAQQLGVSAAAGAFLIGAVLGDTEHSEELSLIMSSIRDMFAALFFVSIGMLVDISLFADFLGPALVVSAVFIAGKVIAITVATFFAGHDGKTSLGVGMGMPQIGEFSLAMVKVGSDRLVVSPFLYPVVTVTTAITSLLYPFIFRSADTAAVVLERRSPKLLKQYLANLAVWLGTLRDSFGFRSATAIQVQHSARLIFINLGVIMVLFGVGTFVLRNAQRLAELVQVQDSIVGLVIGGTVVALCIPSGITIWGSLRTLTDGLSRLALRRFADSARSKEVRSLRIVLRDSMLVLIAFWLVIWSLPFISHLLSLVRLSTPVALVLLLAPIMLTARTAFKIHKILEITFSKTFLGEADQEPGTKGEKEP